MSSVVLQELAEPNEMFLFHYFSGIRVVSSTFQIVF